MKTKLMVLAMTAALGFSGMGYAALSKEEKKAENDRIKARKALEGGQPEPTVARCIVTSVDQHAAVPERVVIRVRAYLACTTDRLKRDCY